MKPFTRRHLQDVLTGWVKPRIDVRGGFVWQDVAFGFTPYPFHRVQLRTGGGQPAELDAQLVGQLQTALGSMRQSPIQEKHDIPATPKGSDVPQVRLEGVLIPFQGSIKADVAGLQVQGTVQHPFLPVASDGYLGLLASWSPGSTQWGRLRHYGGICEQDNRPLTPFQPRLSPLLLGASEVSAWPGCGGAACSDSPGP